MSEQKRIDLGIFTAYGEAVNAGYEGTKEEFEAGLAASADYADNAAASASEAADSAEAAEAWATGGSSGTPSATNNAEYYAGQASGSATAAGTAKTGAETARDLAAQWATGGTTGTPGASNNAKYYSEQAATSADAAATASTNFAPTYSTSGTYVVGDYVLYNGDLYRCTTAISTAEAWTAAHWTAVKLGPDVADVKSAITHLEDGTGIMIPTGYFPDKWKLINNAFGEYKYKYIAENNTFIMNRDKTAAGTVAFGIGMSDSGLSLSERIIPIADYPVVKFHVDSNAPDGTTVQYRVFTYQSNGTTLNNDYYVTVPAGGDCTEDIAKKISDNHWANDVYWTIQQVVADSATYTEAPYLHVTFTGFYTQDEIANWNLVDRLEIIDERLDDLEEMSDSVDALTTALPMYGEKAGSGSPLVTKRVLGFLNDSGNFIGTDSQQSTITERIKCKEGDVFYYYGQSSDSVVTCQWYKEDGTILSSEKVGLGTFDQQIFTAPANAYSVMFTSYIGIAFATQPGLSVTQKTTYESPLSLKKWYPCGDSFTAGEFTGIADFYFTNGPYAGKYKTYPYHIGQRTNMVIYRASTSGETMATYSGGTVVFSDENYAYGYKSVPNDADYITLWFGINDSGHSISIGTIDDDNNTTFYGAWNVVLEDLITRCTKAHIGIIVSNNLASAYVDAVIAVAKKWGIPYLDLNYDNQVPLMHYSLRPDASAEIKAKRNEQFAILPGTNNHPNLLAHEYESYFIEKWLLSL